MQQTEATPNPPPLWSLRSRNLLLGRSIHNYIIEREGGLPLNHYLDSAEWIFRKLLQGDIASWKTVIVAYGIHGRGEDAL